MKGETFPHTKSNSPDKTLNTRWALKIWANCFSDKIFLSTLKILCHSINMKWAFLVLMLVISMAYFPYCSALISTWQTNPYAGHGPFVPGFIAFMLWADRKKLMGIPRRTYSPAIMLIFVGILFLLLGHMNKSMWLQTVSLATTIAGIVAVLYGIKFLKRVAFPIAFVFFVLPPPDSIVLFISPHLRNIATSFSAELLALVGIPCYQNEYVLFLPNISLEIAEACNGIRFLLALLTLASAFAYISQRTTLNRFVLAISAIPIAIIANSIRVASIALGSYYIGPHVANGLTHHAIGKSIWIFTLVPLLFLSFSLRKYVIKKEPYG